MQQMRALVNSSKCWFSLGFLLANLLLSSCLPSSLSDSARLIIAHPVNGSSSSGSSTRLLLRCAGACDGRAVNVTFSNGENFQVKITSCTVFNQSAFGIVLSYAIHFF
jgi:hypothetical protein